MSLFKDRRDAGEKLSKKLSSYSGRDDVIIFALPRGGVPVAFEVANIIKAPLDVFLVRKLGVPGQEELAMGAIATGGVKILNDDIIKTLNISSEEVNNVIDLETKELLRREKMYRGDKKTTDVKGKIVILIDDGLATGASMKSAVASLKLMYPKKIVIAVPTSSVETCDSFEKEVDEIICVYTPEMFRGVGQWYDNFSQITDEEVKDLLEKSKNI